MLLVLFTVNQPLQNRTGFFRVSSPFTTYYTTLLAAKLVPTLSGSQDYLFESVFADS
jgi:hypothetical protein